MDRVASRLDHDSGKMGCGMQARRIMTYALSGWLLSIAVGQAAEWGLKEGTPEIKSATALAFGPDGILFVGDAKGATIYAIDTKDTQGSAAKASVNVPALNEKVASLLGGEATINDMAVNPLTGNVFLAVAKGSDPAIVKVDTAGKLSQVSLKKIPFQKTTLADAPEDKETPSQQPGRPGQNRRNESITDLAYAEGKVFVSGLAAGASPSSVHQIPFPFADGIQGTSVEIYHGAHGKSEDYAAIRTFVPMTINGEPSLLAGFVCTPLVRFPVESLKPGTKTRGTTVAELGNRNRPLDMITYQKGGKTYLLLSNSARGVMKVGTDAITTSDITAPVTGGGTAGQSYETIKDLTGVVQLDKLNDTHAVILAQASQGSPMDLKTIELP